MAYEHPETDHSIDGDHHEDCLELAEDLLTDLETKDYPEHLIDIVEGVVGELKEYEESPGLEEEHKEAEEKVEEEEKGEKDPFALIIRFVNDKNEESSKKNDVKEY